MIQQSMDFSNDRVKNTASDLLKTPRFYSKKSQPKPSKAFDTYWRFAALRQEAFFKKLDTPLAKSFSNDPVIRRHRFTNVYRVSDRVSQYLVQNIQYNQEWSFENCVFRTLLFKIFNKIETWQYIEDNIGEVKWNKDIADEICNVLNTAFSEKITLYSAAYIMPSAKSAFGHQRKHQNHIELMKKIMSNEFLDKLRSANSFEQLYSHLKSLNGIGSFLAYQYAIDLNYSNYFNFSENDFVQAGPGAIDGIHKCFLDIGDYSYADVIALMVELQDQAFDRLDLSFQTLWGRKLHLIDCQNLFCETDKYCRVVHPEIIVGSGRSRIKQIYRPKHSSQELFFPPKWQLSDGKNQQHV